MRPGLYGGEAEKMEGTQSGLPWLRKTEERLAFLSAPVFVFSYLCSLFGVYVPAHPFPEAPIPAAASCPAEIFFLSIMELSSVSAK